jgi:hypothetical protein
MCTSVTLALSGGLVQIWRMRGGGKNGMRYSVSVIRCERSIQGPAADAIRGAGRSRQPVQPWAFFGDASHMQAVRWYLIEKTSGAAAHDIESRSSSLR